MCPEPDITKGKDTGFKAVSMRACSAKGTIYTRLCGLTLCICSTHPMQHNWCSSQLLLQLAFIVQPVPILLPGTKCMSRTVILNIKGSQHWWDSNREDQLYEYIKGKSPTWNMVCHSHFNGNNAQYQTRCPQINTWTG